MGRARAHQEQQTLGQGVPMAPWGPDPRWSTEGHLKALATAWRLYPHLVCSASWQDGRGERKQGREEWVLTLTPSPECQDQHLIEQNVEAADLFRMQDPFPKANDKARDMLGADAVGTRFLLLGNAQKRGLSAPPHGFQLQSPF